MNIEVKPGYSELTVLEFSNKGNEAFDFKPSKLIIRFTQIAHDQYRRKGNDLIYTYQATLAQALLSHPLQIVRVNLFFDH